jgi:HSP20 family molecular chaperone IbpA
MAAQATTIKLANEDANLRRISPEELMARADQTFQVIARRAFELFEGNGHGFGHDLENWFNAESEFLHPTHLSLAESDGALTVQAEVPGFGAKDLEVSVEPRRLTIAGKRDTSREERKDKKILYTERCANQILRVMDLPAEVDTGKVEATLKDGLLELTLPKAAQKKKRGKAAPKA